MRLLAYLNKYAILIEICESKLDNVSLIKLFLVSLSILSVFIKIDYGVDST